MVNWRAGGMFCETDEEGLVCCHRWLSRMVHMLVLAGGDQPSGAR